MFNMLIAQEGTTLAYYNDETGISIWWNNSATFRVWHDGVEVDVFTNYDTNGYNYMTLAATWANDQTV